MEPNAVSATVEAVRQSYARLRENRDALADEVRRISAAPGLSAIGKQQKIAGLRKDVATKVRPVIEHARKLVADAVAVAKGFTLESLFIREEFRNLTATNPTPDLLARVHLATVLPRVSPGELAALMASAVAARELWAVAMIRREASYRVRDAHVQEERSALGNILAAATEVEPADFAARRAGISELERVLPLAEVLWKDIIRLTGGFEYRADDANAA